MEINKNKHIVALIVLLMAAGLVLAACSGHTAEAQTAATQAPGGDRQWECDR